MAKTIKPAPVRRNIDVKVSQARAFEVFTKRTAAWWPKSHHIGKADLEETVIEPRVKGRWYERCVDGSECDWGYVIAWDPPRSLVLAWQLNTSFQFDPSNFTEIEVRFVELGAGLTRVELEHRLDNLSTTEAEAMREQVDSDGGWAGILRSFVQAAEG